MKHSFFLLFFLLSVLISFPASSTSTKNLSNTEPEKISSPDSLPSSSPQSISIIALGLGLNPALTQSAIEQLPKDIMVGIYSFSENIPDILKWLESKPHPLILQYPMEPGGFPEEDPGPLPLLTGIENNENVKRIEKALSNYPVCKGVANFKGNLFLSSSYHFIPVLEAILSKKMFFLETSPPLRPLAITKKSYYKAHFQITPLTSPSDIQALLTNIEDAALLEQQPIVVSFWLSPSTLKFLLEWVPRLEAKKIPIRPLTFEEPHG